jgi:hypothetical protein
MPTREENRRKFESRAAARGLFKSLMLKLLNPEEHIYLRIRMLEAGAEDAVS